MIYFICWCSVFLRVLWCCIVKSTLITTTLRKASNIPRVRVCSNCQQRQGSLKFLFYLKSHHEAYWSLFSSVHYLPPTQVLGQTVQYWTLLDARSIVCRSWQAPSAGSAKPSLGVRHWVGNGFVQCPVVMTLQVFCLCFAFLCITAGCAQALQLWRVWLYSQAFGAVCSLRAVPPVSEVQPCTAVKIFILAVVLHEHSQ